MLDTISKTMLLWQIENEGMGIIFQPTLCLCTRSFSKFRTRVQFDERFYELGNFMVGPIERLLRHLGGT
jgi:hypothetical protein